jgi:hypothetical protein
MAEAKGSLVSQGDQRKISQLIDKLDSGHINITRPPTGDGWEDEEFPTPDVYVAKTPEGGIPALEEYPGEGEETGTGTGTYGEASLPGYGDMDIYKIVKKESVPQLKKVGRAKIRVYNFSTCDVPGNEWVFVIRDKFGYWYVMDVCHVSQLTTTTTSTTTTTTTTFPPSCAGWCAWMWSLADKLWDEIEDPVQGTGTGTGTSTLYGACYEGCACLRPQHCGTFDGEITLTPCTPGEPSYDGYIGSTPCCGQSTTTPIPPTTTTPSICVTGGCCHQWLTSERVWYELYDTCPVFDCPCTGPPNRDGEDCEVVASPCAVTTTTAPPAPSCWGMCKFIWITDAEIACAGGPGTGTGTGPNDENEGDLDVIEHGQMTPKPARDVPEGINDYWWYPPQNGCFKLGSPVPCVCAEPNYPGVPCAVAYTPCYFEVPDDNELDCFTTTTTVPCGGSCIWKGNGSGGWNVMINSCGVGCTCNNPPQYPSVSSDETATTPCGIATSTTTTTTTTTTPAPYQCWTCQWHEDLDGIPGNMVGDPFASCANFDQSGQLDLPNDLLLVCENPTGSYGTDATCNSFECDEPVGPGDCCPGVNLPNQLYAHIAEVAGCPCLDGVTVQLIWDLTASPPGWVGSTNACVDEFTFNLHCTESGLWNLLVRCSATGQSITSTPTSLTCAPLSIVLDYDWSPLTACGTCDGTFTITINDTP